MQHFGEKLRTLRKRRGMTIFAGAETLGYAPTSNSYISEVETGKRTPKIEFVLKVAQFFDVTTAHLVRDDIDLPSQAPADAGSTADANGP
ncbi:MAG: helix-turn-helix domain-containing protein, partial [Chloroflexales bacterium]|nr:helix-turn-helix domain-containing protein [Chloroflexales bacterium]